MPVTRTNLTDVVSYHAPNPEELEQISKLRLGAASFIATILDNTPTCADQSAAVRHVREALMTANASIVLRGLV